MSVLFHINAIACHAYQSDLLNLHLLVPYRFAIRVDLDVWIGKASHTRHSTEVLINNVRDGLLVSIEQGMNSRAGTSGSPSLA